MRSRITAAVCVLAGGVVCSALPAGASTKVKTPTCSAVSASVVRKALGGSPTKPKAQTSANVLICHYTTVDLLYLLHQNKTVFKADQLSNKGTAVKGFGQGAFSYGATAFGGVSFQVLDGNVAFVISGSSAGLKKIEQLAKNIIPLV